MGAEHRSWVGSRSVTPDISLCGRTRDGPAIDPSVTVATVLVRSSCRTHASELRPLAKRGATAKPRRRAGPHLVLGALPWARAASGGGVRSTLAPDSAGVLSTTSASSQRSIRHVRGFLKSVAARIGRTRRSSVRFRHRPLSRRSWPSARHNGARRRGHRRHVVLLAPPPRALPVTLRRGLVVSRGSTRRGEASDRSRTR